MRIVCHATMEEKGLMLEYPSDSVKNEIAKIYKNAVEKSGGYLTVDVARVYKSRTTGEGSQNNKFYALVTEICKQTGNDIEDVKDALKERAIKRGYPYKVNPISNRIKPFSTTKVNTLEMGYLIDETIQLCAELGIDADAVPCEILEHEKAEPKAETEQFDIF